MAACNTVDVGDVSDDEGRAQSRKRVRLLRDDGDTPGGDVLPAERPKHVLNRFGAGMAEVNERFLSGHPAGSAGPRI